MKLGEITLLQVQNVGKIKFASLTLGPNGELVKIAGPNESGKSTLLDSLRFAFESAKSVPNDIIRHGANEATITVQTSGGYTINRKISKDKDGEQSTTLEVKYLGAPVAGGAVTFMKQFSAAYMDPEIVANYSNSEIIKVMAKYAGIDMDVTERNITALRDTATSVRRSINAIGKKTPPPDAPTEPIDLEAATKAYADASETYNQAISKHQSANARIRELDNLAIEYNAKISDLEDQLAAQKSKLEVALNSRAIGAKWIKENPAPDIAIVEAAKAALDSAVAAQSQVGAHAEYKLWYEQKTKLDKALEQAEKDIVDAEKARNTALEQAKFPDPNLRIDDGNPILGEGLWGNGSTSAKLVAAAKLCAASIPEGGARVLYIHRGESIGKERQTLLAQFARDNNVQILMEVMSDTPMDIPDAIIIEEGEVTFVSPDADKVKIAEPEPAVTSVTPKEPELFADAPWKEKPAPAPVSFEDIF